MREISVLYLSYDGLTDQLGQSQILPYIIGLRKKGYVFTIISFEKNNGLYSKEYVQELLDQHDIEWYPLKYTKSPPVLSTLYDYIRLKQSAFSIIRTKKVELVHCRSYLTSLVGLAAKRQLKTKFLFDMRGLWADERVDGGLWNLKNPVFSLIYNFFKKKEKEFFREADACISLTLNGKNEIDSWFPLNKKPKIEIIPCAVDTEIFNSKVVNLIESKALKASLNKDNKKMIVYLGSLGTWYMLEEMLDFFIQLNRKNDWLFLFLTREEKVLKETLKCKGIPMDQIRITEAPRAQIPLYLSICKAGLFFIKPSYSKISSSPTKQAELMSMGVPVIVNSKVGDTAEIVIEHNAGVVNRSFDTEGYNAAIEAFQEKDFDSERIRKGAIDYFGLTKAIENYSKVYKETLH